jgi:kojibiose phosphorylase
VGWTLVQSDLDPATARAYEGLLTLGSAGLHVRGSLEEPLADAPQDRTYDRAPADVTSERFPDTPARWGTFVPGIYGDHPELGTQLLNLPWMLELSLEVDGERLDALRSEVLEHRRELDMRHALIRRVVRWRTSRGPVAVEYERFVISSEPRVVVQRCRVSADRPALLTVRAGLDANVRTNGRDHFATVRFRRLGPAALALCLTTDRSDVVAMATGLGGLRTSAWRLDEAGRRTRLEQDVALAASTPVVIEKRTVVSTSRDQDDAASDRTPDEDVVDRLHRVEQGGYEDLREMHARQWDSRWSSCDVRIDGDVASQRALRVAIFHLLRAHPGSDSRVSIDAKGYAGEAYWGRFFWDSDIFLLPFYLYTDPARARTLVDFRVNTLGGALDNARRAGDVGARYAWESDPEGQECCPNPPYAERELHVTADVVHGLAHYAAATGDHAFLAGPAARVIIETARFWRDRIERGLGEVMGPDEYTIGRHNAYTNRMAAFNLQLAADVGGAGAEGQAFATLAASLPLLRHPRDTDLVLQCQSFHQRPDPELDARWLDRTRPFAAQVEREHLRRSRVLKQADVLMLMMLFPHEFSDTEVRRAWSYYVPLTTHDSSLSPGVHAVIAARLGLREEAWSMWSRACAVDLDATGGGAAEGVHIANAAALWQTVVFGYLGVRTALQSSRLVLAPRLPRAWTRVRLPMVWRGCPVTIDADHQRVRVHNGSSDHAVRLRIGGRDVDVAPDGFVDGAASEPTAGGW